MADWKGGAPPRSRGSWTSELCSSTEPQRRDLTLVEGEAELFVERHQEAETGEELLVLEAGERLDRGLDVIGGEGRRRRALVSEDEDLLEPEASAKAIVDAIFDLVGLLDEDEKRIRCLDRDAPLGGAAPD